MLMVWPNESLSTMLYVTVKPTVPGGPHFVSVTCPDCTRTAMVYVVFETLAVMVPVNGPHPPCELHAMVL